MALYSVGIMPFWHKIQNESLYVYMIDGVFK